MRNKSGYRAMLLLPLFVMCSLNQGCGLIANTTTTSDIYTYSNQQQSSYVERSIAETVVAQGQVVVGNTGDTGVILNNHSPSYATSAIRPYGSGQPVLTILNSINFNVNGNNLIAADGVITLNVNYSDVSEIGLSRVYVRVRLNSDGLTGKTISSQVVPLKLKSSGNNSYQDITSTNMVIQQWTLPFSSTITQTLTLNVMGDFRNRISQQYSTSLIVEVVKDVVNTDVSYYISPSGSDSVGNGSCIYPWKTIAYAASHVPANKNNTIHLKAGIFAESSQINIPLGVNLEGEGVNSTIITSTYNNFLIRFQSNALENGNQSCSGFTINGQNRALSRGMYVVNRNNVVIHDVNFTNIDYTGLEIHNNEVVDRLNGPTFYMTGIQVYNCTFTSCSKDLAGSSTGALSIGTLQNASIHDILINEDRGYGVKGVYGWFKGLKIYNCEVHVAASDPLWGLDCAMELWNVFDDCELFNNNLYSWVSIIGGSKNAGTRSVSIHHNRITFSQPAEAIEGGASDMDINNNYVDGVGYGVAIWPQGSNINNILVHHNIFTGLTRWGIELQTTANGLISNISVYNNVFHTIKNPSWWDVTGVNILFHAACTLDNLTVKNNLMINTGTVNKCTAIFKSGNSSGSIINSSLYNNSFYNVIAQANGYGNVPTLNNITVNPMITASGDKATLYYQPLPGSPLLGAGVDVGLPFTGLKPNIGAF